MEIIGKRNLSDAPCFFIKEIRGYKVYIPQAYNNPISYLKKGCPLWLQINPKGDCFVFENSDERTWEIELETFIANGLPTIYGTETEKTNV